MVVNIMVKNSLSHDQSKKPETGIHLREPHADDGAALNRLVAACPPLDANSLYCNLLQCTHFRATSIAATEADQLLGFISGYLVPDSPDTLFIWQVAVSAAGRRRGLGLRMLKGILARPACARVRFVHTTVNPDNAASRALFTALAREFDAPVRERVLFDRDLHFAGAHPDEVLLNIGPLHRQPPHRQPPQRQSVFPVRT